MCNEIYIHLEYVLCEPIFHSCPVSSQGYPKLHVTHGTRYDDEANIGTCIIYVIDLLIGSIYSRQYAHLMRGLYFQGFSTDTWWNSHKPFGKIIGIKPQPNTRRTDGVLHDDVIKWKHDTHVYNRILCLPITLFQGKYSTKQDVKTMGFSFCLWHYFISPDKGEEYCTFGLYENYIQIKFER